MQQNIAEKAVFSTIFVIHLDGQDTEYVRNT